MDTYEKNSKNTKTMKKLIIITLLFVSGAGASVHAQTANDDISRIQLINALERAQREVKSSRIYVDALRQQVESKEARITALNQKDELSTQAIKNLQSEVSNLRLAVTEAEAVMSIREKEVLTLKNQLEKTRKKLNRARTFTKYLSVVAGVLAGIVILK
jgi:chromosome segregation ATPase